MIPLKSKPNKKLLNWHAVGVVLCTGTFLHEQKHPADPDGKTVHAAHNRASDNLLRLL